MNEVTLIGSADRLLPDLLHEAGNRVTVADLAALTALAEPHSAQPDAVVIDLRRDFVLPAAVAALKINHPSTGVLVVGATPDPALLLESIRAGVSEFISGPLSTGELEAAMSRVIKRRPADTAGRVFGFIGAKGGVGTTTVAVNVAATLARVAEPGRALLVDMDRSSGDAAVFFDASPRFSIVDALENAPRLDSTFFQGLVTQVGTSLDLLASSDRYLPPMAETARVRALIDFVSASYRYTVIDLPRSESAVLDALDRLTTIVIVANQELATVRSATRMAAALRHRYGAEKVMVVLSRSDRQADIGITEIERTIGRDVSHMFPSDYRLAVQAIHRGKPLVSLGASELATAFEQLAMQIAGVPVGKAPERSLSLFSRFSNARRSG